MEKRKDQLLGLSLSIIFCLIIFSGCATKETVKSLSDEEVLKERVTAYWNHKIREEFDKNYDYESPLYRKQVTLSQYANGFTTGGKVRWAGMGIESVKIDSESAKIALKVKLAVASSEPSRKIEPESLITEQWVKVEGIWYHVPQKVK